MAWPIVELSEVIKQDQSYVTALEPVTYEKLSVKLFGRGVVRDKLVDGASILMKKHQFARAGQIIVSEIWAKKGALGIVPPEGDGALCTSHFYLFDIDTSRLIPRWFHYLTVANYFEPQISKAARGTTGYASVRPKRFLQCVIPLPLPDKQRHMAARLDRVTMLIEEATKLQEEVERDVAALTQSLHTALCSGEARPLGDFVYLWEDRQAIQPDVLYPQVGIKGFAGGLFTKAPVKGSETSYRWFNRLHDGLLVVSQPKGWEGAIAVCTRNLAGWFVSPEYRTFRCHEDRLTPRYLDMLIQTPWFQNQLAQLTRGQGARRERLRPEMLLAMNTKMPSLDAQATALGVVDHCRTVRSKFTDIEKELSELLPAMLHKVFGREAGCSAA